MMPRETRSASTGVLMRSRLNRSAASDLTFSNEINSEASAGETSAMAA